MGIAESIAIVGVVLFLIVVSYHKGEQKAYKEMEQDKNEKLKIEKELRLQSAYDKVWEMHRILEESGVMKYDSDLCRWVAVKVKK